MQLKRNSAIFLPLMLLIMAALACSFNPFDRNGADATDAGAAAEVAVQAVPIGPTAAAGEMAPIVNQPIVSTLDLEQRLIDLYDQVNPAVVQIVVYSVLDNAVPMGSGSGFIYSEEGYIVTNNHVVQDSDELEVVFYDGSRRWATLIGTDVDSDLAVIHVDSLPETTHAIGLGDSDQIRVGQLVIAIGNPFGEQGSMSLGIVSGLGRSLVSQRQIDSGGAYSLPQVIQTDAPINPGNSGGPLIDLAGQVVGVNSAIRSTTGVNSGVGFSIPVNAVSRIVPKLIQDGAYTYSYMGAQILTLNLNTQELYEVPQAQGAYVTGVVEDSPAAAAGLVPASVEDGTGGDLITAINGELIMDTESLIAYLVFHTEVGQTIDLTVMRDGETITVPLTLGARP